MQEHTTARDSIIAERFFFHAKHIFTTIFHVFDKKEIFSYPYNI